jgi:hypothetical protein
MDGNRQTTSASSPLWKEKFRRALKNVPSKAFIRRNSEGAVTLFIRPMNLLVFGSSLNNRGLEHCPNTRSILQHLDKNPDEFIRFEHAGF